MLPRRIRDLLVLLGLFVLIAGSALAGIGWYYSDQLLGLVGPDDYTITVRAAGHGTVTLDRTRDSQRDGTFGLEWPEGSAVIGTVTQIGPDTVTRKVVQGSPPTPGTKTEIDTSVYPTDPADAVHLTYSDVDFPSERGPMPAWFVAGTRSTWVITVHGRGSSRREALRIMPTLHRLGLPVLDIAYRNDVGAPASEDRKYHLGATEWRDLDAAVTYARHQGAQRIVLYGWSMGGAIVGQWLERSAQTAVVSRIVLDAPVLDWRAVLALQAKQRHLPSIVTRAAEFVVSRRIGVDFDDFDLVKRPQLFQVPTLVFFGDDDTTVPIEPARRLAAEDPDVSLRTFGGADHTQSWNVDPTAYDDDVRGFLSPLVGRRAA